MRVRRTRGTILTGRARELRRFQTDAEQKIWKILRNRQINGYRFHRQFVIGPYIGDFVCRDLDLIIEVDGGQHNDEQDLKRTVYLEAAGYKVIRFWNNDILNNIDGIYNVIVRKLEEMEKERTSSGNTLTPTISLKGEGGKNWSGEHWKYSNVNGALKKLSLQSAPCVWEMSGAFDYIVPSQDQNVIHLSFPKNCRIDQPVELSLSGQDGGQHDGRVILEIEDGASVKIIERQRGSGAYWKNLSFDIKVGKNASLELYRLCEEDPFCVVTEFVTVDVARDARFRAVVVNGCSGFGRNEFTVNMNGENGEADLSGLGLLRGKQHGDTTVCVNHIAPHCRSSQFFKTILKDQSRGVYQGKIHVFKDAQKTDGYQLSNNLLMSPLAEMDVKPELEIYADDVKCSHGSTTGELDETPMFYLMSRGIPEDAARQLLIEAFVGEILDKVPCEKVRRLFEERVALWLR